MEWIIGLVISFSVSFCVVLVLSMVRVAGRCDDELILMKNGDILSDGDFVINTKDIYVSALEYAHTYMNLATEINNGKISGFNKER